MPPDPSTTTLRAACDRITSWDGANEPARQREIARELLLIAGPEAFPTGWATNGRREFVRRCVFRSIRAWRGRGAGGTYVGVNGVMRALKEETR